MFKPIHLSTTLTFITLATGAGFYYQDKNQSLVEPTTAETNKTRVLTVDDFGAFGHKDQSLREFPTMRAQINPELAPFTFAIDSYVEPTTGAINIYADDGKTVVQKIDISDPNMRLADRIHEHFNVADINFDGYADIGVLLDGGAKWGAYQYWTFDKTSNQFVSTTFTDEFRKLNFNQWQLNSEAKQIRVNNFCGSLICDNDLYQVENNNLKLIEELHQEQSYSTANDSTPLKECVITTKKYLNDTVETVTETIPEFCEGYYWK